MQNFMAELMEPLPRRDSSNFEGEITKNWGRDRRRREKPPKAGKIAEGGKLSKMGSQELRSCPWGYFYMDKQNFTSRKQTFYMFGVDASIISFHP